MLLEKAATTLVYNNRGILKKGHDLSMGISNYELQCLWHVTTTLCL